MTLESSWGWTYTVLYSKHVHMLFSDSSTLLACMYIDEFNTHVMVAPAAMPSPCPNTLPLLPVLMQPSLRSSAMRQPGAQNPPWCRSGRPWQQQQQHAAAAQQAQLPQPLLPSMLLAWGEGQSPG